MVQIITAMSLNITKFTSEFNEFMMHEELYFKNPEISPDLICVFVGAMIVWLLLAWCIQGKIDEEDGFEDEEEDFIVFPETLTVHEDGDLYIFNKHHFTIEANGDLRVITGELLKRFERKQRAIERKQRRNEQRQMEAEELRIRQENMRLQEEERVIELNRIAEETHLQELITELSTIVENRQQEQDNTPRKRQPRAYTRPMDYGHRYLNDKDILTSTLRGQTVDVLYRKGVTVKDDLYLAVFKGDLQSTEFKTLNQVAATLAARVAINGPNAWTAFKRVRSNGTHESIDRLDSIE